MGKTLYHYTDNSTTESIRREGKLKSRKSKVWASTLLPEKIFGRFGRIYQILLGGSHSLEFGGPLGKHL